MNKVRISLVLAVLVVTGAAVGFYACTEQPAPLVVQNSADKDVDSPKKPVCYISGTFKKAGKDSLLKDIGGMIRMNLDLSGTNAENYENECLEMAVQTCIRNSGMIEGPVFTPFLKGYFKPTRDSERRVDFEIDSKCKAERKTK